MRKCFRIGLLLLIPVGVYSQVVSGPSGIRWKSAEILPAMTVLEAHDNRVQIDDSGNATSDYYSEVSAGIEVRNLPARYDLSVSATYGYRFYSQYQSINDHFYDVSVSVGSTENALQWSISSELAKTLNYNKTYDPDTGSGPETILTDGIPRSINTEGEVAYVMSISEKTTLVPSYSLQYFYQDFEGLESAEWQMHSVGMVMNYAYSPKTTFMVGGYYEIQVNGDEAGQIVSVGVGIERVISDKTSLRAMVGYGSADYDHSGSSRGGLADIRAQWQATDKISIYIFYGNNFQPGYGGNPARMLYRAGCGAEWQLFAKWNLGAQVLRSYDDALGRGNSDTLYGGARHFFAAQCRYTMTSKLALSLEGNYVNDEEPVNQTVVSIRLSYAY
ncbi:MAG: hypothetical protein V5783_09745 [Pontiella sp.]